MKYREITRMIAGLLVLILFSTSTYAQVSNTCAIAVYEGQKVQLAPEAFDPDPDIGPAGQLLWSFGAPFDKNASWQTQKGDAGIHNFFVTVTDGELSDTKTACVEVLSQNQDPVLDPLPEYHVMAGQNSQLSASCWDPDDDMVTIDFELNGHPIAYVYYSEPGDYPLKVICSDGFGGMDTEMTTLHVDDPGRPQMPGPRPVVVPQVEEVETVNIPVPVILPNIEIKQESHGEPEVVCPPVNQPQPTEVIEIVHEASGEPASACPTAQPTQVIEVVNQPSTVCPEPVVQNPQVVEVVNQPVTVCPEPVQPAQQQVEVVQQPTTACPTAQPQTPQVIEVVNQPVTVCPEPVQPAQQQVEVVQQPTTACPTAQPTQIETVYPTNAPPKEVYNEPEKCEITVKKQCVIPETKIEVEMQLCDSQQEIVVYDEQAQKKKVVPQIIEVEEELCKEKPKPKTYTDTVTYTIEYDTKPLTTKEKIVRALKRKPIDRKLEITGFLQKDCECDDPADECQQDM